ncbi:MAG: alpha-L-fucosidase, partial [Thermoguttaceae bacterium]
VGPTAEGKIPDASLERLAGIGQWMKVYGESIYGTHASPLGAVPWGRCTQKALEGGKTRLYLHVFDWPAQGKLTVPIKNKVLGAACLASGAKLDASSADGSLVINLPAKAPNPIASVLTLDVEGTVAP